MLRRDSSSRLL
ncbi:unnamed protein product [Linum tenue]|uniref:Uncharacterized protein n=1 Tax=Linum tenue TaxID=586396 RepID=A0AAV0PWN9_9ROSI|nr:unnamed protein product [Linum tenue]CAI0475204.1 unnamed protein product [Linum tenue]CAI0560809.1 unnamed protein product [Linum tenue]